MPVFSKMLLDALQKAPPASLEDMRVFFDRARARLEQSLDKGGVSGSDREAYIDQFEAGADEAQLVFLNTVLDAAHGAGAGSSAAATSWYRQPMVWAALVGALLAGIAIGLVFGR